MANMELLLLGIVAVGLLLWIRGYLKHSVGTCILGLLVGVIAAAGYFVAFSLTRTPYFAASLLASFVLCVLCVPSFVRQPAGKALLGVALALTAAAAIVEYKVVSTGNALLVIQPYRSGSTWRFDEPLLHLKGEPFVQGINEMIDRMVEGIPGSDKSVRLTFSQRPFPGWQHRLDLQREEMGGNWYHNEAWDMKGWLCPALFKFFPRAPRHIYVKAEPC